MKMAITMQGVTASTQAHRITSRSMSSAECDSLRCQDARFGYALTNIGDLDRDGYPGKLYTCHLNLGTCEAS